MQGHRGEARPGFLRGALYPLRGARFVYVEHSGLAGLWLPPLIITAALIVAATWFVLANHVAWFAALWSVPQGQAVLDWVLRGLHWAASWAFPVLLVAVGAVLALLAGSVLAAPWNEALSAAVERIARGTEDDPLSLARLLRDAVKAVGFASVRLGAYLCVVLGLLALGLLPLAGPVLQAILGFGATALFLVIDYADFAAARRGLGVRERFAHVRRHLPSALGMGVALWAMMLVPGLNLLLAPAAVAGATLWFADTYLGPAPREPGRA
jgi:CysZ protein